ncbi:histidine phosphatase family protein [Mycolicibacterium pallens]|uniref:Histidine phosphatase family protein n=1 Tax=Mycolicibacterium pallens TaxID=370524 RepID=A0ABX8VDD1_9MYCO|nr:histidine phosphatase family protein [Mycolicibacterium pallens]
MGVAASVGRAADKSADLVRHVPKPFSLTGVTAGQRTLILMRHAKSDYPDGVADHDRPLASRGIREAGLAGEWLRVNVPSIELVLCSSATRTRQTLDYTAIDAPVNYSERLYGATPGTMLAEINQVPDDVATVMVVGHEPTMSQLSLGLADPDRSDPEAADQISIKYPTSAIAVLNVPGSWAALELGGAELALFHVPR